MPDRYALIVGSKRYYHNVGSDTHFGKKCKEYWNDSDISGISCVAVGPTVNDFALTTSGGGSYWNGPADFHSEWRGFKKTEIKHMSFGPNGTWAVTMKNGWVKGKLNPDVCKHVNEHKGDISYVSLGPRKSDWIVGWGRNGYVTGGGLSVNLTSFLKGVNASKQEIKLVEIGGNPHYFVHHSNGYYFNLPEEPHEWFKNRDEALVSVSLWRY